MEGNNLDYGTKFSMVRKIKEPKPKNFPVWNIHLPKKKKMFPSPISVFFFFTFLVILHLLFINFISIPVFYLSSFFAQ